MLSLRCSNDSVKNVLTDIGSVASSESIDHPTDRVRVYVRIRPLNSNERSRGHKSILRPINDSGIIVVDPASFEVANRPDLAFIDPKCWSRNFTFDHCLWSVQENDNNISFATQDSVFEVIGQPVVNWALEGHNCCILAYGQTGTGKSYTMMGNMAGNPSGYGLIPRICFSLFDLIEENNNNNEHENIIEFSHLEIYNETIRDLLSPSNNNTLKVREHPNHGVYVANLTSVRVSTFEEIMSLIAVGDRERTVASTNMNAHSSRSHAIVTLTLRQSLRNNSHSNKTSPSPTSLQRKTSRLHLVDLAGSERATLSGATGNRLRETNKINRSLSVLGDVIKCLGESRGGNKKVHIPYRNSLLTMVLKDSLGGNAHTVMMAAVSPSGLDYEETVSTLKYADRAKRVRMRVQANVMNSELGGDAALELVPLLKAEVKKLREMLLSQQTQQQLVLPAPDNQLAAAEIVREMQVRVQELERQLAEREKLIQSLVTAKSESFDTTAIVPTTINGNNNNNTLLSNSPRSFYSKNINRLSPNSHHPISSQTSNSEVEDISMIVSCLVDLNPNSTLSSFSEAGVIAIPDDTPLRIGANQSIVDVVLPGNDIYPIHCIFTADDSTGKINLTIPQNNAIITINNIRVYHHYALQNLDTIGIGNNYQFRFEQHRVSLDDFNEEEDNNNNDDNSTKDGNHDSNQKFSYVNNGYDNNSTNISSTTNNSNVDNNNNKIGISKYDNPTAKIPATATTTTTSTLSMMDDFNNDISFMNRVRNIEREMNVTAIGYIQNKAISSYSNSNHFSDDNNITRVDKNYHNRYNNNDSNNSNNDNNNSNNDNNNNNVSNTKSFPVTLTTATTPTTKTPINSTITTTSTGSSSSSAAHLSPSCDIWWDKLGKVAEGENTNDSQELQDMLQTVLQRAEARSTKAKTALDIYGQQQNQQLLPPPTSHPTSNHLDNKEVKYDTIRANGQHITQTTTSSTLAMTASKHLSPRLLNKVSNYNRKPTTSTSTANTISDSLAYQSIHPNINTSNNNGNIDHSSNNTTTSITNKTDRSDNTGNTLTTNNISSSTRNAATILGNNDFNSINMREAKGVPVITTIEHPNTTTRAASTSNTSLINQSSTGGNSRIFHNPTGSTGNLKPVSLQSLPKGFRIPTPASKIDATAIPPPPPPLQATASVNSITVNKKYFPLTTNKMTSSSTGNTTTANSQLSNITSTIKTISTSNNTALKSSSSISESEKESQELEDEVEDLERILQTRMLRYQPTIPPPPSLSSTTTSTTSKSSMVIGGQQSRQKIENDIGMNLKYTRR